MADVSVRPAGPDDVAEIARVQVETWRTCYLAILPGPVIESLSTDSVGPLLVEPRWGRRGHGSRLLAAAVDLARLDGMTRATAWITEGDVVSREFFTSAGWAPDGLARALNTGAGELREIRLHASLAEAAA
jgi:GNAT superfamily N-acetyltransferase